ncbi:hypothetical protein C5167_027388, partial [Papaver somniferum]
MENNSSTMISWEKKIFMINELLTQAKEEVKQLEMHLAPSAITCGKLSIAKIVSAFEISLFMLNEIKLEGRGDQPQITQIELPLSSVSRSPRSDYESDLMTNYSKKRKILPKWTKKERVCELTGFEGPPDDAYSWRKYGQKDILNNNYPRCHCYFYRAYYRCTHRDVQRCLAKKLVQRTDEDPSLFCITYWGKHTCIQAWHLQPGEQHKKHDLKHNKSKETLTNFQTSCHVKAEDFATRVLASFSLHFTSKPASCLEKENNNTIFSSLTPDNHFGGSLLSPPLMSSEVSDQYTLQTSEYDVNELISAAALDACPSFQDLDSDIPIQS